MTERTVFYVTHPDALERWPRDDGAGAIPMVPCDEPAVERAAIALRKNTWRLAPLYRYRKMARAVLRAAGEPNHD